MLNTILSITLGFYNISTWNDNKKKNTHRKSISPLWNVYSCMSMCSPRCCGEKFQLREKLDGVGGWELITGRAEECGQSASPCGLAACSSWSRAAPVKSRNICCLSCSFRACLQLLSLRLFRVFFFCFVLFSLTWLFDFLFLCGVWGRHSTLILCL